MDGQVSPLTVVEYPYSIAHMASVAVEMDGLMLEGGKDRLEDKLFGMLPDAVVIGAASDTYVQTEGGVVRPLPSRLRRHCWPHKGPWEIGLPPR